MSTTPDALVSLSRTRRILGVVNIVGILMVLGALVYAATQLQHLQSRKAQLESQINALTQQAGTLKQQVSDLSGQRAQLQNQVQTSTEILARLNKAIAGSKDKSLTSKAETIQLSALAGYKIAIYYLADNAAAAAQANDLRAKLTEANCPAPIQIDPRPRSFFDNVQPPLDNEVRYEPDYENAQAQALMLLLSRIDPQTHFVLRPVGNRTPQFISIFLKSGF